MRADNRRGRSRQDMDLRAILGESYESSDNDNRNNDDWDDMRRDFDSRFVEDAQEASFEKEKKKDSVAGNIILFIIAAAICLAAALVTPAALVIQNDEKVVDIRKASIDIANGFSSLKTNVISASMDLPKVYLLPVSSDGGMKYSKSRASTYKDEKGVKHTVYEDPTIKVDLWKERGKASGSHYDANIARVKIAHPTQLRTAISTSGFANRSSAKKIAKGKNAIVAVNGDFYTLIKYGVSLKQGTFYRKKSDNSQVLLIDENGDFSIMTSKQALKSNWFESHNIYNALTFGPALVVDGEISYANPKDNVKNPRTGIGQIGPLEYLMIVVDGRSSKSAGVSIPDFAKMFYNKGCTVAYNLDGGQSSTMVFLDSVYNQVSNNGERSISDIVYFASAYPEGGEE